VTASTSEYAMLALALAQAPERLAALRRQLERSLASAPLFDTARFARHLETAYALMWQDFVAGVAPRAIAVPALAGSPAPCIERATASPSSRAPRAAPAPELELSP
jgi:hypothetical protein